MTVNIWHDILSLRNDTKVSNEGVGKVKAIADLKSLIKGKQEKGRKTLKIEEVEPFLSDIGVAYAQTSKKFTDSRDSLSKLRKEMEELKKLNAALAMRLGYDMMTKEDENRIMGRSHRDVKRIRRRKDKKTL